MKTFVISSLILLGILWASPGITGKVKKLEWQDLIPADLLAADPLSQLPVEEQDMVNWIIYLRENLPSIVPPEDQELLDELNAAIPVLKEKGLDIDKIIAKRHEINNSVVAELDGAQVTIPGYLLPLEMSGTEVTEFLLVPYVGACIHVPPPPPNQIVHVTLTGKKGYSSKELFDPVWVTGVISSKSMVKDLFLNDGSDDIDIGYSMVAQKVEAYAQ